MTDQSDNTNTTALPCNRIEHNVPFSQSLLWVLQRQYFMDKGFEAWRQGEVPHYITSNPIIAASYAEIVLAFFKERQARTSGRNTTDEPLYIMELGAGSGRFAFYFLLQLRRLCEETDIPITRFRYIITDFTQSNLDFWKLHPKFTSFIEDGLMDMALFDITSSETIRLQKSGHTINLAQLQQPLVVIANYVFDGIPQDLLYFGKPEVQQCLVSLYTQKDPQEISAAALLDGIQYRYDYTTAPVYKEPALQELVDFYRQTLSDSHVLIPAETLNCIQRLQKLSAEGLLLLAGDKGDHRPDGWADNPPPYIDHHGSFSLNVNYHALQYCCHADGGIALFPEHRYNGLNIGCFLWMHDAENYVSTRKAYARFVSDSGPDDFYTMFRHARQHINTMSVAEIISIMRLSMYDSVLFAQVLPRLHEWLPEMSVAEIKDIAFMARRVWEHYFPLAEEQDLIDQMARFFYAADQYEEALFYFAESSRIYGSDTGTFYNMALCRQMLGQYEAAAVLLEALLAEDPDNTEAGELLVICSAKK